LFSGSTRQTGIAQAGAEFRPLRLGAANGCMFDKSVRIGTRARAKIAARRRHAERRQLSFCECVPVAVLSFRRYHPSTRSPIRYRLTRLTSPWADRETILRCLALHWPVLFGGANSSRTCLQRRSGSISPAFACSIIFVTTSSVIGSPGLHSSSRASHTF
jgi:hypothetical protein